VSEIGISTRAWPRWAGWGLAALLVLATLAEGGGSPRGLLLWHGWLVLLLAASLWRTRDARRRAPGAGAGVVLSWTLFMGLSVVAVIRAPYTYGALLVMLELGACTVAAYLAAGAGPDLLRRIVAPLGAVAAVQAGLATYQSIAAESRPAGTFLVPNHLALWLSAVVLLLVGRALGGGRADRVQAWALGLPALLGVVVAGSRGAVLGLAAGGAWLLAISLGRLSSRRRSIVIVATAVVLVLLGAGLLSRMRGHDPFRYQRLKIWRASLGAYLDDPFWGSGPGQFGALAANHRFPDGDGPLRYDRAHRATHSDWLRVPVEFGTPAALVILATLALGVRQIHRNRRRGQLPDFSDGALAGLIAIAVHAAVDNPTRWPAVYLLASVLVGTLLATPPEPSTPPVGRRPLDFVGLTALTGALVFVFLVVDVAPFMAWRSVAGLPRGRLDDAQQQRLGTAIRLNRLHPDYRMRLAEHLAAGPHGFDSYAAAREAAEQAVRLQPADARYRHDMARIEARACIEIFRTSGCRERVRLHYMNAEQLSRYDPAIPLELAMFLLDLGDGVGARRAAERALALEPEAVLSRLVLAEALIESDASSAAARSGELLNEAERKAEQWAGWTDGEHARRLLTLDREQFERVRRRIAIASSVDRSAEGAPR